MNQDPDYIAALASGDLGYGDVRVINNKVCGTFRLLYTHSVMVDIDSDGNYDGGRICFDTHQNAALFLADWDGKTRPVVGVDGCKADKLR